MAVTNYFTIEGEMVGEFRGNTAETVETQVYLRDYLGSTAETRNADPSTDSRYQYLPYGGWLFSSGSGSTPRYLWDGTWGYRTTDLANVSHYVRARHYDAKSGIWTSLDPVWPVEPAYLYAAETPAKMIDPTGLEKIAVQLNAFVPKRFGWMPEPGAILPWEMKGDQRTANQPGSSRIGIRVEVDSCTIGGAAPVIRLNTGVSRRRLWVAVGYVYQTLNSTVLQATKNFVLRKEIGGPCETFVHAVVRSAYPFLPPLAPTQIGIKVFFKVVGRKTVLLTGGISHSIFPDTELLLKFRNVSRLLYHYGTPYPGWTLILPADKLYYFSKVLSAATDTCCTDIPCCAGSCPP